MNKNNALFLDEYKKLDDMCKESLDINDGIAGYVKKMEESEGPKKNVDAWVDDYHTLAKCLHIDGLIADEVMGGKAQCTKQDIAWIKKFASRINKDADAIAKLKKYEATVAKFKETLEKAIPVAQNIAIGCGVTLVATAILGKKKKK
jgi:hypothetical protein